MQQCVRTIHAYDFISPPWEPCFLFPPSSHSNDLFIFSDYTSSSNTVSLCLSVSVSISPSLFFFSASISLSLSLSGFLWLSLFSLCLYPSFFFSISNLQTSFTYFTACCFNKVFKGQYPDCILYILIETKVEVGAFSQPELLFLSMRVCFYIPILGSAFTCH